MITEISIKGFKSLHDVDRLSLGQFNLLIGPNASGKSNFLDALRVLQGIGFGLTIDENFNGKPKSSTGESWPGIRGGLKLAGHMIRGPMSDGLEILDSHTPGANVRIAVKVSLKREGVRSASADYSVEINPGTTRLISERLVVDNESIYDTTQLQQEESRPTIRARCSKGGAKGQPPVLDFPTHVPILGQARERQELPDKSKELVGLVRAALGDLQSLDPIPTELRKYSYATNVRRLGDRGENFAALVETISKDAASRAALVNWLRELRPAEIDDVEILEGAIGDRLFGIKEGKKSMPATVLSDGTLRFAAIVAAFLQPSMPAMMTVEEIENGVHASRMRLLVELLRTQTARTGLQVFATTHSPIVLAWLKPEEYRNVLWFKRDESGATRITPLDQDPDVAEVLRKQPIAGLFAEGWLEGVM